MFEVSEVVKLLVGFASVPVVLILARRVAIPRAKILYAGFACLLSGYIFTVMEEVARPELLNLLEHYSYAAAGLCFFVFVLPLRSRSGAETESS